MRQTAGAKKTNSYLMKICFRIKKIKPTVNINKGFKFL